MYVGVLNSDTKLPLSRMIMVMRKEKAFMIKSIVTDDPNLQVAIEATKPGHEYRISMVYKGGWKLGTVNRNITVTTDDSEQPQIVIPVLANVMSEPGK
jgi:hypothetical protein